MRNFLFVVMAVFVFASCEKRDKYDVDQYFSKAEQDTIMTNIVTYIYKVPRGVDPKNKHDLAYRKLYVSQINQFEFVNYHIDAVDSIHYFFLIRPARNVHNHKRGVLGKYKLGKELQLLDFEEIANTPMLAVDEIREKGAYLWEDLMYFGNLDRFYLNKAYVEFPDERTRYDFDKKVWTYEKL
ncbi:hypothetical protein [Pararhodonellum marinum]|uniref:hypothetical protein n=1 Tax=Pararhodonellum marinum TaxID=2755358 RepID=UPI00188E0F7D|nr:hypothetical protein [Pararhodonellum marinum]